MKKFTESEFRGNFDAIYRAHSGRIYNFVLHLAKGDRYKAEEVTQMTFLRLWEMRDEIDRVDSIQSYLFTIARNTFLNICEHETVEYTYYNYVLRNSATPTDTSTENTVNHNFMMGYILNIMNDMTPMRRLVFQKSRFEHKNTRQIAEELNISPNTVEIHLTLALKYIKEQLRKRYNVLTYLFFLILNTFSIGWII